MDYTPFLGCFGTGQNVRVIQNYVFLIVVAFSVNRTFNIYTFQVLIKFLQLMYMINIM